MNKKLRDEASLDKLKELNPHVNVSLLRFEKSFNNIFEYTNALCEKVLQFDVVVFTELQACSLLCQVNNICRKNNIKFIYACCLGLAGYIFTDFGDKHIIFEESGGAPTTYNIKSITKDTKDKKGLVTIDNEKGENNFSIGENCTIKFSDIKGMTELNDKEFQVEYENFESFKIKQDTSNFHDYIGGGKAIKVVKNRTKIYFDFASRSNIITDNLHQFLILDEDKVGRSELLYMALIGVHDFFMSHNGFLPELNNLE